jgi:diguanylate cyclase (GGDEF)-like protein/PAS domain S-box-containing protein
VARLQVATDITERKQAEEAVAESEKKYRALFNQVADPVVITDGENRRILDFNDAMLEAYGYTRPELLEMTLIDLMVEEERAAALATLETHRMGRSIASVHRTRAGQTIDVEIVTDEVVYQGRPAWISVIRDIGEHKREEMRLSRLANFDPLTGLANRNLFQDRISQALARSERSSDSVALLYMDLDHFKEVNDFLGHAAGDQLLRLVAGRLEASVRKVDTVARLGGDEFIILLEGIRHPKDAPAVAEKLINRLRMPFEVEGQELRVTTSIGLALFPQDAKDADTLLRCADIALYHAKRQGRDSVQSYSPELGEQRTRPSAPVE